MDAFGTPAESAAARADAGNRATAGAREGARAAARGARTPRESHSVLFRTKGDTFAFIDTQRTRFSVVSLCRRAGMSEGAITSQAWPHSRSARCRTYPAPLAS